MNNLHPPMIWKRKYNAEREAMTLFLYFKDYEEYREHCTCFCSIDKNGEKRFACFDADVQDPWPYVASLSCNTPELLAEFKEWFRQAMEARQEFINISLS